MEMLICNDGSEQAERAMRLGSLIAAGCKANVTILGIIEHADDSREILDCLRRGQAGLEAGGIHAELITKSGEPIHEIVARTEEAQYDLVVIGAVRRDSHGLFRISSNTYKIIKEVTPPVLAVAGAGENLKRILVCSGGKRYRSAAMQLTGELALAMGATVTLFNVLPELPGMYFGLRGLEETTTWLLNSNSELGLNLRHEKETLETMGVVTDVRLSHGHVLEEIFREIRDGGYDLIVTGSSLSTGLRGYMMGDVTREIVIHSKGAVLVVRGPEKRQSAGGLFGLFGRKSRD